MNVSSSRLTPVLKTRFSVKLRITLRCVKNTRSVGVGLGSEAACSPTGYEILMKTNKLLIEDHYLKIEMGTESQLSSPLLLSFLLHFQPISASNDSQMFSICFPPRSAYPGKVVPGCGPHLPPPPIPCPQPSVPRCASFRSPFADHGLGLVLCPTSFLHVHRLATDISPGILSFISVNHTAI